MAEYDCGTGDFLSDQLLGGTGRYTVDGYHGGTAQWQSVRGEIAIEALRWANSLTVDLVSYWKLEEASGTRYDVVGDADLADIATVGQQDGRIGKAADFVRTNSEVLRDVGNSSLSFGDVDFTFVGWFKVDDLNTNKGLIAKWNAFTSNTKEYLLFYNGGATNRFTFAVSDNSSNATVTSPTVVVADTWYFIQVWHDSVNNKIWIQVDDETPTSTNWSNGVYANDNDFELGHFVDAGNGQQYHDGGIDAVGAWRRILTAAERARLYAYGLGIQHPFRAVDRGAFEETTEQAPPPRREFGGGTAPTGPETDWFDHVWILPTRIDAGLILNEKKVYDITVYNSYRYETRDLEDFVNNAGDGVVITNLPTLPDTIETQSGYDLDLEILPQGPPFIDGTLDFEFDVRDVSITLTGQRTVVFPHEPEAPLVETLIFETDVRRGRTGTEQRAALRHIPRSQYEMRFLVTGDERRQLEANVFDSQDQLFGVPAWHEAAILATAATSGQTTITVDSTAYSSLRDDGLAMLYMSHDNSLTLQIESMTATTITFTTQLTSNFPVGALVLPVRMGLIRSKSIRGRKWRTNLQEVRVTFMTWDNDEDLSSTSAWSSFNSKVLLDDPNLIQETLPESSERKIAIIDNETGTFETYSEWDVSRRAHSKGFFTRGRQDLWEVRQLLHALRGRCVSFYIPTFFDELALASDVSSGDSTVTVENVGYTKFVDSRQPRNVVRLTKLSTGDEVIRTVTDATELDAATERLTVDSTWGKAFTVGDTKIDYIEKVRLDSDRIRIEHLDGIGEAKIVVPVISVLD
jgi:hypothetical protein